MTTEKQGNNNKKICKAMHKQKEKINRETMKKQALFLELKNTITGLKIY